MIFASDLDRTLIYSAAALGIPETSPGIRPAETKEGRVISYISEKALELLIRFAGRAVFMPVTTRTVEQYRRIHLFQDTVIPDYAVTSNGGNILVNGEVDLQWRRHIGSRVAKESAGAGEVLETIRSVVRSEWVIGEYYCDELFYSLTVYRDLLPKEEIAELTANLLKVGWSVSVQGRKLYAVPAAVNKRDAIRHIRDRESEDLMVASGDSLLDGPLLESADYAIAPCHGELYRRCEETGTAAAYPFTRTGGVFAADEILAYVWEQYNLHDLQIAKTLEAGPA